VVEGRDALRQLFGTFAAAAAKIGVLDVRFHQTDDPAVAFVEERMVADLHGGGRYENTLVIRVTFRGELIQEIFEYYGQVAHQALARGLGAGA
jgi:ketosteroid isomerase-like protein